MPAGVDDEVIARCMRIVNRMNGLELYPIDRRSRPHHRRNGDEFAATPDSDDIQFIVRSERFPPRAKPYTRQKHAVHTASLHKAIPFGRQIDQSAQVANNTDSKISVRQLLCMCEDLFFNQTSFFPVTK